MFKLLDFPDRFSDDLSTYEDSSNCGGSFRRGKLFKYDGYAAAYDGKCGNEWPCSHFKPVLPSSCSSRTLSRTFGIKIFNTMGTWTQLHVLRMQEWHNFGVRHCDKGSNISDYHILLPGVDFSLIESDEDVLWKADIREANEELAERGLQFLNWKKTVDAEGEADSSCYS